MQWCLKPNPQKFEVKASQLTTNKHPTEILMSCSVGTQPLNYIPGSHAKTAKIAYEIKSGNELAVIFWGAKGDTLRTAAMALTYSVADHCAPLWCERNSCPTQRSNESPNGHVEAHSYSMASNPCQLPP